MAKRKTKKEKGLWAVWDRDNDCVTVYSTKPTESKDTCSYCNSEYPIYSGTYVTEFCTELAKHIPGLTEGGPPVKFQVVVG